MLNSEKKLIFKKLIFLRKIKPKSQRLPFEEEEEF